MGLFLGGRMFAPKPAAGVGGAGDIEGVTAGNGLTGGGASGTVTLNVGAGTGITVNANDVQTDATVVAHLGTASNWTAAQTLGLEDAGTTTVLVPLILARTSSGTAAAGLGVAASLRAEDASGNTDEAGRMDSAWVVATDGATQSSRVGLWIRSANSMVEAARVLATADFSAGNLLDLDAVLSIGRATIDSRTTDNAYFGHRDQLGGTAAHLRITAAGTAILNCTSGQSTSIRHADTTRIQVNTTGIGFFAATPVAQQTVGAVSYSVVDYATDGATIKNHLGQLATALRNLGLGA